MRVKSKWVLDRRAFTWPIVETLVFSMYCVWQSRLVRVGHNVMDVAAFPCRRRCPEEVVCGNAKSVACKSSKRDQLCGK